MKEYLEQRIKDLGCADKVEIAIQSLRSRATNSQMDTYHYGLAMGLYEALQHLPSNLSL